MRRGSPWRCAQTIFRSIAVLAALVAQGPAAAADGLTKEQCVAANESAPALRQKGELRAARMQLLSCLAPMCPRPVRDDCADQLKELEPLIPTIVFEVTSAGGRDLSQVAVVMDGVRLVDSIDGTALPVDPGIHTFSVTAHGYKPAVIKLQIRGRAKGRREHVTLEPELDGDTEERLILRETLAGTSYSRPSNVRGPIGLTAADQQLAGCVVGGSGVVALLLGTYFTGVDGVESGHTQPAVSTISFVAGAVLLGGAVALFLTMPPTATRVPRQQSHAGNW